MSVIIRDACISDAPRLLEIYSYYVQHTAISFEYNTPTQEEFCRRMRHIMSRYPYLVAEVDGRTGIYVQSVEETAPAARAGMKAGDVILTVNGQSVTSVEELRDILYDTGVGGTVDVVVLRDGSEIQMSFALYANS